MVLGGRLSRRRERTSQLARSPDDPDAFAYFYEDNAERIVVFFLRRTFDAECALDLCGETFALALERRRQFRGRTIAEERAWLFAIARSVLSHFWRQGTAERNALQRVAVHPAAMSMSEVDQLDRMAGLEELRSSLALALSELSPDQAFAIRQRVVAERSYADLSSELGVSEDVVRARVSRGLRVLSDLLSDQDLSAVA